MIDIHSHILPGIDDGPSDMAEAIEMAVMAVDDGIRTMVATPHTLNGIHLNYREDILSACDEFNRELKKKDISLEVLPGSEVHLDVDIIRDLDRGKLMTLNDAGRYLSLELPPYFVAGTIVDFINRIRFRGITPIISHPERNRTIQQNEGLLDELISAGAMSQITAESLTGGFGRDIYRISRKMIRMNLVHFMATDSHSFIKRRLPRLSEAVRRLSDLTDKEMLEKITILNPREVVGELAHS